MKPSSLTLPAANATRELLRNAYPGESRAVTEMREQIFEFATSPSAKTVFLSGPTGIGKSTVARHIAYLKAHALTDSSNPDALRSEYVRYAGPNLIDHRMMDWYVELPLTGLVESIAESQLFGVAKGAFTGAVERPGVFELAKQDEKSFGVKVTGGVVFLDEVAELSGILQTKLLPVLSGGAFYRVGGEGSPKYLVEYQGVVITASWREISEIMRPDLYARLTAHIIRLPGLEERTEDLPAIIQALAGTTLASFQRELARLRKLELDPRIASTYLEALDGSIALPDPECVRHLTSVNWAEHGQLRGLAQALDKIILQHRAPADVTSALPQVRRPHGQPTLADPLLEFAETVHDRSLAACVRSYEARAREDLRSRVNADPAFCGRLATSLHTPAADIKKQAANLARDRRSR